MTIIIVKILLNSYLSTTTFSFLLKLMRKKKSYLIFCQIALWSFIVLNYSNQFCVKDPFMLSSLKVRLKIRVRSFPALTTPSAAVGADIPKSAKVI